MGLVPGSRSIPKSTSRDGGIPGRSFGKTSINSFTMDTISIGFSFPFVFTAQARNAHPPCCTRCLAFIIDIIFGVVPVEVPLNLKVSDMNHDQGISIPQGPITRMRAKKLQQVFHLIC